jgi:hypothetical protein
MGSASQAGPAGEEVSAVYALEPGEHAGGELRALRTYSQRCDHREPECVRDGLEGCHTAPIGLLLARALLAVVHQAGEHHHLQRTYSGRVGEPVTAVQSHNAPSIDAA